MQATVLVILCEGEKTLAVHQTDADAWSALIAFVDRRWEDRYGAITPPSEEALRAQAFFRDDEMFLVATANLSDLKAHLHDSSPGEEWLEVFRLP